MRNLQRRVKALEQAAGVGDELADVDVFHVHDGGPVQAMTPAEWREYRRKHSGDDFITIRETMEV